jgi:amidase
MPSSRRKAAAALIAAPFLSRFPRARAAAATSKFDPEYATARQALDALAAGTISSHELTTHVLARIRKLNPKVNAFMLLREEAALAEAKQADAQRKRDANRPLHGLPVSVKDAFATAGIRTTAGSKIWENFIPKEDAVAVAKLRAAGAIIVGKTNLPEFSADLQSYNDIAGTTNNPWNAGRTCGGSTGGGAAAIASGFSYLELGSDSGGSIRIPSHFCGVFGHKSTVHLVSRTGWMPPAPGDFRGPNDWSVAGPLARSAEDLKLMLDVIAGPDSEQGVAYRWTPPPSRRRTLFEYRIGWVADDPYCPVAPETSKALAPLFKALSQAGKVREGWPAGFDFKRNYEVFRFLTTAFQAASISEAQRKALEGEFGGPHEEYARATLEAVRAPYETWEKFHIERLKLRRVWQEYFKEYDVLITPVTIVPAIQHDHSMPRHRRVVETGSGKRPYSDLSPWISPAGLSGCPATVVPVAMTSGPEPLPVGVQIIGPFLEDLTPIHVASLLSQNLTGPFKRPAL